MKNINRPAVCVKVLKDEPTNIWKAVTTSLVVAAFLCNAGAIVFGYLNSTSTGDLFINNVSYLSDKYYNEVAPMGIIFVIIWPIIFFLTFAGSVYMLVSLCLPSNQSPVKIVPPLAPNSYFLFICFGFISNILWLFAFDRENLAYAFSCLALATLSFVFAIVMTVILVERNPSKLDTTMLWVMRVLIYNGLGMIAAWLIVATSINLSIVMLYEDSPGQDTPTLRGLFTVDDASAIVLGGVGVIISVWFLLQNFVWQKFYAYLFTDYPVFIMAYSGIVAKLSLNPADRSLIVASVVLGLAALLFLGRIALSIYRFINHDYIKMSESAADKARLIEKEN